MNSCFCLPGHFGEIQGFVAPYVSQIYACAVLAVFGRYYWLARSQRETPQTHDMVMLLVGCAGFGTGLYAVARIFSGPIELLEANALLMYGAVAIQRGSATVADQFAKLSPTPRLTPTPVTPPDDPDPPRGSN